MKIVPGGKQLAGPVRYTSLYNELQIALDAVATLLLQSMAGDPQRKLAKFKKNKKKIFQNTSGIFERNFVHDDFPFFLRLCNRFIYFLHPCY
jgi:hypothetical protein